MAGSSLRYVGFMTVPRSVPRYFLSSWTDPVGKLGQPQGAGQFQGDLLPPHRERGDSKAISPLLHMLQVSRQGSGKTRVPDRSSELQQKHGLCSTSKPRDIQNNTNPQCTLTVAITPTLPCSDLQNNTSPSVQL